MMRFSLILCTINRVDEVRIFLTSLAVQREAPSFEVILVDQNPDDRLRPIIANFENKFPIRCLTSKPGLSRARNIGLEHAAGEIVAFPDDDCQYPEKLLKEVSDYLTDDWLDGMSILATDRKGQLSSGYMFRNHRWITLGNARHSGVSISIFIKREAIGELRFDETLGVGSGTVYGSGEETDFLLNLVREKKVLKFNPDLSVYHPVFKGPWSLKRGFLYGSGTGRVLHKHHFSFFQALYSVGLMLIRALMALLQLNFPKIMFYLAMAWGRFSGYLRGVIKHEPTV